MVTAIALRKDSRFQLTSDDESLDCLLASPQLGFDAKDTNLTRYVGNAPTLLTDPSGLQPPGSRPGLPPDNENAGPAPQNYVEFDVTYLKKAYLLGKLFVDVNGLDVKTRVQIRRTPELGKDYREMWDKSDDLFDIPPSWERSQRIVQPRVCKVGFGYLAGEGVT